MNWDKRTVSKKEGIFRSEEGSEKEGKGVNKIIGEGRGVSHCHRFICCTNIMGFLTDKVNYLTAHWNANVNSETLFLH